MPIHQENTLFGFHAVEALLKNHPDRVDRLLLLQNRQDKKIQTIIQYAEKNQLNIQWASRHELDALTHQANHQGVVAFLRQMAHYTEKDLENIVDQAEKKI